MNESAGAPRAQKEPLLDFGDKERDTQGMIDRAIARIRAELLGKTLPHLIAGQPHFSGKRFRRMNPSDTRECIGETVFASLEAVEEAVRVTLRSKDAREWARMPLAARAPFLRRWAENIRKKDLFFIGLSVLEVGKQSWLADGEVCEAIELLKADADYAEGKEPEANAKLRSPKGRKNSAVFVPYGPRIPLCASIQPWNFPLAISAGPVAAALVCGHSVLYKPAEQSSTIGYYLAKTLYEAGIPPEIFHFLPGDGGEVGAAMVAHKDVSGVMFTGSLEVRRAIRDAIADFNRTNPPWEKRAYALESGGKNAMIVGPDADVNYVVSDVAESKFGFQGQRCSSVDILLIVDPSPRQVRYKEITHRLVEHVTGLCIGSPEDPANSVGPLVDEKALEKVLRYMRLAEKEGTVLVHKDPPLGLPGYFPPLMVVHGLPRDSAILRDEIFGPLLAVVHVESKEEAVAFMERINHALTLSVHSRDEEFVAFILREVAAGVKYIRTATVGAVPGEQNFGGGKWSGNGTKAGSPTYLDPLLFEVNHSENTLQCGIPME